MKATQLTETLLQLSRVECLAHESVCTLRFSKKSLNTAVNISIHSCFCTRLKISQITIQIPLTPLEQLTPHIRTAIFPYQDVTDQKFQTSVYGSQTMKSPTTGKALGEAGGSPALFGQAALRSDSVWRRSC